MLLGSAAVLLPGSASQFGAAMLSEGISSFGHSILEASGALLVLMVTIGTPNNGLSRFHTFASRIVAATPGCTPRRKMTLSVSNHLFFKLALCTH